MLYSIYPVESVLEDEGEELNLIEMELERKRILLKQNGTFSFQIERIISTDPNDYMDEGLYPGLSITLM